MNVIIDNVEEELYMEKLRREQKGNYNYYKAFNHEESLILRKLYLKYVINFAEEIIEQMPLFISNGTCISNHKANRIVVGDYGAYVEFEQTALKNGLLIPIFKNPPTRPVKYIGYTFKDSDAKVYDQHNTVNYADYKPGKMYINITDLYMKNKLSELIHLSSFNEFEQKIKSKMSKRYLEYDKEDMEFLMTTFNMRKNFIETGNVIFGKNDLLKFSKEYKEKNGLQNKELSPGQQEAVDKIQKYLDQIINK